MDQVHGYLAAAKRRRENTVQDGPTEPGECWWAFGGLKSYIKDLNANDPSIHLVFVPAMHEIYIVFK